MGDHVIDPKMGLLAESQAGAKGRHPDHEERRQFVGPGAGPSQKVSRDDLPTDIEHENRDQSDEGQLEALDGEVSQEGQGFQNGLTLGGSFRWCRPQLTNAGDEVAHWSVAVGLVKGLDRGAEGRFVGTGDFDTLRLECFQGSFCFLLP